MLVQLNNKSSLGMSRTICESVLFTEVPGDVAPVLLTNLRELRLHEKESIPQDKELLTTDVCPPCLHRSVNSFLVKLLMYRVILKTCFLKAGTLRYCLTPTDLFVVIEL